MFMWTVVGLAALILGALLGLFGAGGSILALPVLVYLCGVKPLLATNYSLGIVGVTALVGAIGKARQGHVSLNTGLTFGLPAVAGVTLARAVLLPMTPEVIYQSHGVEVSRDWLLLVLFSLLMIVAGLMMALRPGVSKHEHVSKVTPAKLPPKALSLLALEGVVVGIITGFAGVGGGFLIVPVLVLLVGLPMQAAVGTSLMIIALKSLLGFVVDYSLWHSIDWKFLTLFSLAALVGMIGGSLLSDRLGAARLSRAFGWLVTTIGLFMLVTELM